MRINFRSIGASVVVSILTVLFFHSSAIADKPIENYGDLKFVKECRFHLNYEEFQTAISILVRRYLLASLTLTIKVQLDRLHPQTRTRDLPPLARPAAVFRMVNVDATLQKGEPTVGGLMTRTVW